MKLILAISVFFVCTFNAIFSQSFTGGSDSIFDLQTINVPVNVSGLPSNINFTSFGLEQVCINLTHTYLADIDVSLIAPDGTIVTLITNIGGGDDDFQNTCVRADVTTTFAAGIAPFTGTFKPMGQMGLVNNGQNPNGTWFLRISDNYGADQGFLQDFTITFGNTPATYFQLTESDLPIVVINTNGQTIVDEPKIMADMGIIYNGEGVRNHIIDPKNEYNGKIGIEIRGNYSAILPQKPYSLELQDANGNAIDSTILGMPAENDWQLIANYNDKSFARNILPYHLFDTMGHYATRCRLVDVVINGEYKGIYLLTEKIKRDSIRVDIPKLEITETTGQDVTGGYILKIDYWDNSNSWLLNYHPIGFPTVDVYMVYYYPDPAVIVPEQKTYIQGFIYDFETALYGPNFADTAIGYRKYIGTTSFIDYFIVNELARNVDGYKKSRFFYKDKDKNDGTLRKLKAGPVWDFDWALKDMTAGSEDGSGFMYGEVDQDVDAPGWYIRLLEDSTFRDELRCRYDDLRRTILQESYLNQKIDSVAAKVNESQSWHFETWANLGVATGTGEVQAPAQTYAEEVQRLKDWLQRRLAWLDINIPGTLNGCSFTGIDENNFQALGAQAFPNPFKDQISVKFTPEFNQIIQYKLMDQTGRLMEEKSVQINSQNGNQLEIKGLENLETGVYLLEIEFKGQKSVSKLLK